MQQEIVQGKRLAGQSLNAVELATQLGISRSPVREAIRLLESDGMVINSPNRGAFVAPLSRQDVIDLYECRRLLECHCLESAMSSMTSHDLATLRQWLEAMEAALEAGQLDRYHEANTLFHSHLNGLCSNKIIVQMYQLAWARTMRYRPLLLPDRHHAEASLAGHRLLMEAIESGDTSRANSILADLMAASSRRIVQAIDHLPTPPGEVETMTT